MKIENLKLKKGYHLIEPVRETESDSDLLHLPFEEETLPSSGFIVKSGESSEGLREEDLVVFPTLALDIPHIRTRLLHLTFAREEVFCDPDYEPFLHALRKGAKKIITMQDIEKKEFEFLSSDLLSVELVELTNPAISTRYTNNLHLIKIEGEEYYLIHERNILCTIKGWQ